LKKVSSTLSAWQGAHLLGVQAKALNLPYSYTICEDVINDLPSEAESLIDAFQAKRIERVRLQTEEFYLAGELLSRHPQITKEEGVALSIAIQRDMLVLVDNGVFRKAVLAEGASSLNVQDLLEPESRKHGRDGPQTT